MSCIRRVSLVINCGYARVCVYQNSNPHRVGQHARQFIDIPKRAINFRTQFSTYHFPENYFKESGKNRTTQFDRDCNKILDGFKAKFSGRMDRESYLTNFSHSKWCELPAEEKNNIQCQVVKDALTYTRISSSLFPLNLSTTLAQSYL